MSISVEYYSFNEKRADKLWEKFPDDFAKAKAGEKIESGWRAPLANLTYEGEARDEDTVINDLKFLDLYYGSVGTNPTPESGKQEYYVHKAIAEAAGLKHEADYQPKDDWIKIYSQIDDAYIETAVSIIMKDTGWENDEGREILIEFLRNVRPVVKDLKENEDSIFVTDWDTDWKVSPESAEELLMKRAKNHLENFRNLMSVN
ncbi:MAG: hypothetical protein COU35_05300 [Candidatus Magasanikbacteria bacterium CG10_big_fil_rev_8_21_14_0_10_47_10]|uniref:Uncharacterized protein n=1 Tax=Candidatus Magasanikbacteria bacterium CG10_big_fil_rev_8_21_14_0_10_47_10 TaxID=1974652 RepID=A0A2H0TP62_9BACT|nr:MAG: hypothetical protein COU35_05300 [Candidatus Magasanikbacteria bacterium CG10_big_fil_rev_8_21_14_0_10_47_10]